MKRLLAALIAGAALALPARAAVTSSVDYSDLWWNSAENGWGAQLQQQGDVIFMTLYVYAADTTSTWFVASAMLPLERDASAPPAWSGDLYRTAGPPAAGGFDPHSVTQERVGTATVEFATSTTGTLRYTVGGEQIAKAITRLTWRANLPAVGAYHGGLSAALTTCPEPGMDGPFELVGAMNVTVTGARVSFAFSTDEFSGRTSRCTFGGDYRQDGRLGTIAGTFSCTLYFGADDRGEAPRNVNKSGTFTLSGIESAASGVFGRLAAHDQDCHIDGYIGGVRKP